MSSESESSSPNAQADDAAKRALDVMGAAFGLVVTAPLLAAIAVGVKASSPGGVLFRHERVGRGWRRFSVLKFRTMVQGSEKMGAAVTAQGDARVTGLGKILRKTKLDELPQLWNVLVGDMSLVGPRPEAPRYAEQYPDEYDRILSIRPGITDEAAIAYRNEEEILGASDDPEQTYIDEILPKKMELYRRYIEDHSLSGDLSILLRTVGKVLKP